MTILTPKCNVHERRDALASLIVFALHASKTPPVGVQTPRGMFRSSTESSLLCDFDRRPLLLFGLLVFRVGLAPLAVLLELDLFGNKFSVLARPIIDVVALRAGDLYELIL